MVFADLVDSLGGGAVADSIEDSLGDRLVGFVADLLVDLDADTIAGEDWVPSLVVDLHE